MSRRTKIILIIAIVALILGAIGFGIYYFFFRPAPVVPPEEIKPGEVVHLPTKKPGAPEVVPVAPAPPTPPTLAPAAIPSAVLPQVTLPAVSLRPEPGKDILVESLSDVPAQNATLAANGTDVFYYNKQEGKFYKVTPDGAKTLLSEKNFYQVKNVDWSPTKNEAILEYPDGSKIFYDFEQEKQTTIPSNWYSFSFSSDGNKVAFMTESVEPRDRWLAIANPDGSGTQAIEQVGENADKVDVLWSPNNQIIATSRTGESLGAERQEILMVGLHGENFKSLTVEGYDFLPKWSPRGDKMLYSVYSMQFDFKPTLWITNAQGDDIGANNLYLGVQTWADKCVFSSDNKTLYCAVPEDLPRGSGLIKDLAANSSDTWYRIDIETGLKTALANPIRYNAVNPLLSGDEKYLYFTDKNTGLLEKIELK